MSAEPQPGAPSAAAELDGDLLAALRAIGAEVAAVAPVAGHGYPGYRASAYRIELTGGGALKGRLFARPADAERADFVARSLGARYVSAPLARHGAALITEWVAGPPPGMGDDMLRRCGALQALVHGTPLPADAPHRRRPTMADRRRILERDVGELAGAGVVAAEEAGALLAIASRHAPGDCAIGFVLNDLSAENLVVRASGEPCFIDHDTLAIGACEYDLGRTWYRWPMHGGQRAALHAGYARVRSLEPFLAHFPYWAIAALVAGARFRIGRDVAGAAEPLGRLRALLADLRRGLAPREAAYRR